MTISDNSNPFTDRVQRKFVRAYLSSARRIWKHLPSSTLDRPIVRGYGNHLDKLVRRYSDRRQYFATFFLRNRPELELLRRISSQWLNGSKLNLTVLACSKGAEVYSMAWAIRSSRPDLELNIHAIDISQEIVDFAARGVYSLDRSDSPDTETNNGSGDVGWNTSRDQPSSMFERMSKEEIDAIFEIEGNQAKVRPWLKQGITWSCGDAGDPALRKLLGPQDIIVANRFLCHMEPQVAQECLRNIANLVKCGGHLFVSGIDLDVRTKVALESGWSPITELAREIHDGDTSIRRGWPFEYWGLEPMDINRPDSQIRYASVFQIGSQVPNTLGECTCTEASRR